MGKNAIKNDVNAEFIYHLKNCAQQQTRRVMFYGIIKKGTRIYLSHFAIDAVVRT